MTTAERHELRQSNFEELVAVRHIAQNQCALSVECCHVSNWPQTPGYPVGYLTEGERDAVEEIERRQREGCEVCGDGRAPWGKRTGGERMTPLQRAEWERAYGLELTEQQLAILRGDPPTRPEPAADVIAIR